ncbi:ATP-binding cassette domain-containing protein [Aureimonas ureilytica]|nr:ATP-binding cassette domain-containing protein [Aureimonas ureilytica]
MDRPQETSAVRWAMLEIESLRVAMGGRVLLDGIGFSLRAGERVCVLGASGSGKSLTAAAITGILPAGFHSEGSVRVAGHEVLRQRAPQRPKDARVALISQDTQSALNPLVSIGAQLVEPLRRHGGLGREAARDAALALLRSVDLPATPAFLETSPADLSGGQRQRVCIALALACRTGLIVADEPTTALDLVTQAKVLRLLGERTGDQGPALLLVTHDLSAARMACERVLVLAEGRIVEDRPMDDLFAAPRHDFTRELVACALAEARPFSPADLEAA